MCDEILWFLLFIVVFFSAMCERDSERKETKNIFTGAPDIFRTNIFIFSCCNCVDADCCEISHMHFFISTQFFSSRKNVGKTGKINKWTIIKKTNWKTITCKDSLFRIFIIRVA